MAANLALTSDNQVMMASYRRNPWHNSGTIFQEEVSGSEMLKLAHLDWDVLESPVYTQVGTMTQKATGWDAPTDTPIITNVLENIRQVEIPGIKSVYRGDTGNPLGVVGQDFRVFQNSEMIKLFEGLANGHKIIFETAGGLNDGETIWIMARIPDLKLDIGGDELNSYMLISNGHTGNRTLTVAGSTCRVVCQNTLTIATQEFRNRLRKNNGRKNVNTGYAIRHTKSMSVAVKQVEQSYAALLSDITITKEIFEKMMGKQVNTVMKNSFFDYIVSPKTEEIQDAKEMSKRGETMKANRIQVLEKLYESPTNQTKASKDTVWGLYNCVTEMIDHERSTRNCTTGSDDACRFQSAQFGTGKDLKDLAFSKCIELINA